MIDIRRYSPEMADEWNQFVAQSKNGTFLFDRRYMDYHADRFQDHSLMFFRKNRLFALLPAVLHATPHPLSTPQPLRSAQRDAFVAKRRKNPSTPQHLNLSTPQPSSSIYGSACAAALPQHPCLVSHPGLTYGGLITGTHATTAAISDLFSTLNDYLCHEGISHVVYKPTPHIYHRLPAEEDLYALTAVCNARLTVREVSSAIIRQPRLPFTESRRSGLRKALAAGITVGESQDLASFWHILDDNLWQTYGVHPVHTLSELQLLKQRFPDRIRLFAAMSEGDMLGGTLIYDTGRVVHTQYISASAKGKSQGALDILFDHLINEVFADAACFDFGKSTYNGGRCLNHQLIFQKEGFGARAICYDTYEWDTSAEKKDN